MTKSEVITLSLNCSSSTSIVARWLELMVALIHEQVHKSVICINHHLDLIQVLLLLELNFTPIILRQHADLPLAHLHLSSSLEQKSVGLWANLRLNDTFVDEVTGKFERFFTAHVEALSLVKFQ